MQSLSVTTDTVSSNLCGAKGIVVVVIVWWLDLQLPMQLVSITTYVVSSYLDQG